MLFKFCEQPDITLAQVKRSPSDVSFARWFVGDLRDQWNNILLAVEEI